MFKQTIALPLPAFGSPMPTRTWSDPNAKYKYGFNGKEKDNEVTVDGGDYDFGARIYDSRLGRWLSIDPLWKVYTDLSTFNFVSNNPIYLIDKDGQRIIVANLAQQATILRMINSKALGLFDFNAAGELYQVRATGDATRYSTYYRDKLVEAINNPLTIEIEIKNNIIEPLENSVTGELVKDASGVALDVDVDRGGGVTFGSGSVADGSTPSDQLIYISGNENRTGTDISGNPMISSAADILAHELVGHAIPHIVGTDTGNAITNENKVKTETNGPERQADSFHDE